jgi:uncharacterized protein
MDPDCGRLTEQEIEAVLLKEQVGCLALAAEGQPYLVPLNFVYEQGMIYFHSRTSGRKVDMISSNAQACFHAATIGPIITGKNPCKFNYTFSSVIIEGIVEEVAVLPDKEEILELLVEKYAGKTMKRGMMAEKQITGVKVFRLRPQAVSGKRNT